MSLNKLVVSIAIIGTILFSIVAASATQADTWHSHTPTGESDLSIAG